MNHGWRFVDQSGAFVLQDPQKNSYLYFPLVNEAGMMSSITPLLHGDIKTGQNNFLMLPVSVEDLQLPVGAELLGLRGGHGSMVGDREFGGTNRPEFFG